MEIKKGGVIVALYILEVKTLGSFQCGCQDYDTTFEISFCTKDELIKKTKERNLKIVKAEGFFQEIVKGCGCCNFCSYGNSCNYSPETSELSWEYVHYVTTEETVVYERMCDVCAPFYTVDREYWEGDVDFLFHSSILTHGLSTPFNGRWISHDEIIERGVAVADNPDWQICCCDKYNSIGSVGLFLQGWVHYASNKDLWSYINELGDRIFDLDRYSHYLIQNKSQMDLSVWDHTELIVSHYTIKGVWVKKSSLMKDPGLQRVVDTLSKNLDVKIFYIKDRRR